MTLTDLAFRAAGLRARPAALASSRPPAGAIESPNYAGIPHQPLWPAFEGPNIVALSDRNLYARRCVEKIASSIAGLPYCAGNMTSHTPRPTSQRQQLLGPAPGGPNPQWSAAKLWRYSIIQYLILGKFAWLHEYDSTGTRIVALWPLMSQWLVPVIAPVGAKGYFESFRYGLRGSAGYREFKPDEITYIWRPSQEDIRQPEAPLRLARWGITIARLLDEYDHGFLSNGGVPAHLIITPPFDSAAERRAFRDQFRRKFGGSANTNKAAFAETETEPGDIGGGQPAQTSIDVKVIGQSQKDSQMDVMRSGRIEDMCAALGVPISLLGVSNASKYTNMQTDRENYWRETVSDYIKELQDAVDLAFAGRMDGIKDVGWFDTSAIPEMRKPPVFTEEGGIAAVAAGLVSPNDYRTDRGLPPLDEEDAGVARPRPLTGVLAGTAPALEPPVPVPDALPATDELPAKPVLKVVKAVRTDLLDVVRAQLAVELADQRRELEARRDGKRGGRNRAHAALDLALVYDRNHWQARMVRNLEPATRAAGFGQHDLNQWSVDVTDAVFEQLDGTTGFVDDVFDADGYMPALGRPFTPHRVESGFVEQALLQLHSGSATLDGVLGTIGAG